MPQLYIRRTSNPPRNAGEESYRSIKDFVVRTKTSSNILRRCNGINLDLAIYLTLLSYSFAYSRYKFAVLSSYDANQMYITINFGKVILF